MEENKELARKWGWEKVKGFYIDAEYFDNGYDRMYFLEDAKGEVIIDCEYWTQTACSSPTEQCYEEWEDVLEWIEDREDEEPCDCKGCVKLRDDDS